MDREKPYNRRLFQAERQRNMTRHRQAIKAVRATIDNKSPHIPSHLAYNAKKAASQQGDRFAKLAVQSAQYGAERRWEIRQANSTLVRHLMAIRPTIDNKTSGHSLNKANGKLLTAMQTRDAHRANMVSCAVSVILWEELTDVPLC